MLVTRHIQNVQRQLSRDLEDVRELKAGLKAEAARDARSERIRELELEVRDLRAMRAQLEERYAGELSELEGSYRGRLSAAEERARERLREAEAAAQRSEEAWSLFSQSKEHVGELVDRVSALEEEKSQLEQSHEQELHRILDRKAKRIEELEGAVERLREESPETDWDAYDVGDLAPDAPERAAAPLPPSPLECDARRIVELTEELREAERQRVELETRHMQEMMQLADHTRSRLEESERLRGERDAELDRLRERLQELEQSKPAATEPPAPFGSTPPPTPSSLIELMRDEDDEPRRRDLTDGEAALVRLEELFEDPEAA